MHEMERRDAHIDHAYTQVIAEHTVEQGTEQDAQLDDAIQERLRNIYARASAHSAQATSYHRFGMSSEVLLAGETVGRIDALSDLGYITLQAAKTKVVAGSN